jgi:hypothetical protein
MKLIIIEDKISTEMTRIKNLFIKYYKSYLNNKSRSFKLDQLEEVIEQCLTDKTDLKLLLYRLSSKLTGQKKKPSKEDK